MIFSLLIGFAIAASGTLPGATEVTIYNQGFGLVKENRALNLKTGRQNVAIEDVAAQIEPNSVAFESLTQKGSINVLEQNYQYDLVSPEAILNKAIGSKIRFIRTLPNATKEVLMGTLMSSPTAIVNPGTQNGGSSQTYNGMVIKTDDGRILINPTGEIEVSSIPEGLISKPTLVWDIETAKAGPNMIELRYITHGMTWNADYVLTLDDQGGHADLQGWVTLNNSCGVTYKNARLKLLAGDVHQAAGPVEMSMAMRSVDRLAIAKDAFQEQSLFEYHLYTLQRPTTLQNNETKQVSLLEGHGVKIEKKLIVDSMLDVGRYYPAEGEVGTGTTCPQVRLEFANFKKENNLGMPLPEGTVKVYQKDNSGSVQMLGEDSIKHTPRDERLSLVVGKSFDVVAERKRMEFHYNPVPERPYQLNDRSTTEVFQITVRNHKEVPQSVVVLERHYGDWTIEKTSDPFTKTDSNSMEYMVNVPPNGSKVITYTVRTVW